MDYCQYILSKCSSDIIKEATNQAYEDADTLLNQYYKSSSFINDEAAGNIRIIRLIKKALRENMKDKSWDSDGVKVIESCKNRCKSITANDEIFDVMADYLWLCSSKQVSREKNPKRKFSLIKDSSIELSESIKYIESMQADISNAAYILKCIDEAENLSILKHLFTFLIDNPDIIKYMPGNMELKQRKGLIEYYENYINDEEPLYYALLATHIYKYEIQRKYE